MRIVSEFKWSETIGIGFGFGVDVEDGRPVWNPISITIPTVSMPTGFETSA